MQTQIQYGPAYAAAIVTLAQGEQIRAESGAMVAMDPGIEIETAATGGFMKSLSRSVLGGESFFQNTFTATRPGTVVFAPNLAGDIIEFPLDGDLYVQSGSYLASELSITVDSKWGGARTFFGGEGLFMLKCSGRGALLLSSFGAIHPMKLAAGQQITIDTGHLVAFSGSMNYSVRKIGSWKSTIFGGEGFVVDCQGPADLYIQTRSPRAFLSWLVPQLPRDMNS